jgi:hypothetical protein
MCCCCVLLCAAGVLVCWCAGVLVCAKCYMNLINTPHTGCLSYFRASVLPCFMSQKGVTMTHYVRSLSITHGLLFEIARHIGIPQINKGEYRLQVQH